MAISGEDLAHILIALGLLMLAAHAMGQIASFIGQPPVIGEIVGGLVLGPTLLGTVAPAAQTWMFPTTGPVASVLGWWYQLGLLLLMFCSGAEMRSVFRRQEARLVGSVTFAGLVFPFLAGMLLFTRLDSSALTGSADNRTAVLLVFSLAIAVTSIPVISRIMFDLGIIDTSFARVVLAVAVVEDLVVYVVLALTLGMVSAAGDEQFGLPGVLRLGSASAANMIFHTLVTVVFFVVMLLLGPSAFRWTGRSRWNVVARKNPIAYTLLFFFGTTLGCVLLGITPIFGAFLAGIAASAESHPEGTAARTSIKTLSFALFIPVYFAIVGLQLDLVGHFDALFTIGFLIFACTVKAASVYFAARLSGEAPSAARNFAVATNARGGPGIVLASVAFGASIISESFFVTLVVLSILTSLLAGTWLAHIIRSGRSLRAEPAREVSGSVSRVS